MPAKLAGMGFKRASFVNDMTFEEWSRKLEGRNSKVASAYRTRTFTSTHDRSRFRISSH
jgi:hypothetical protein